MNERDRGNDSIFLTTLIVEEGGKRTLQDVRVASKSLLDNKQRDPPTTWPPFFLLLTRKSSMLGAMPICSTEETYNVTIKGDGWHARKCFLFASGGTVDGTNATRLRHCRASGGHLVCACPTLVGSHGKTGKHKGRLESGNFYFRWGG